MYASRLLPRVTRHCKASHPFHTRGCCHFRVPSITAATKCYLAPSHPASEEAVKDWRQVSPGNSRTTIRFVVADLVLTSRILLTCISQHDQQQYPAFILPMSFHPKIARRAKTRIFAIKSFPPVKRILRISFVTLSTPERFPSLGKHKSDESV